MRTQPLRKLCQIWECVKKTKTKNKIMIHVEIGIWLCMCISFIFICNMGEEIIMSYLRAKSWKAEATSEVIIVILKREKLKKKDI